MNENESEGLQRIDDQVLNLLLQNREKFLAFLFRRLGDKSLAEDIVQGSLRKALISEPHFSGESDAISWFFTILRRALIDHARKLAREHKKLEELRRDCESHNNQELKTEVCTCLNDLIPILKPDYAILLQRIDLNGESVGSVAASLDLTENNLYVKLHRARKALRQSLEHTCGACSKHGCLNCTCKTP